MTLRQGTLLGVASDRGIGATHGLIESEVTEALPSKTAAAAARPMMAGGMACCRLGAAGSCAVPSELSPGGVTEQVNQRGALARTAKTAPRRKNGGALAQRVANDSLDRRAAMEHGTVAAGSR